MGDDSKVQHDSAAMAFASRVTYGVQDQLKPPTMSASGLHHLFTSYFLLLTIFFFLEYVGTD